MKSILTIGCLFTASIAFSQKDAAEKALQSGNEFYKQQKFVQAAQEYTKAVEADPQNEVAKFNLANALYKQDRKVDAVQVYAEIARTDDVAMRSKAWYNKGVILTNQKNLEESIEAYKNALRNDPNDTEARENLQKALLELKNKKEEKKKQDQQPQKKKEEQKKQSPPKMQPKEADQRLRLLQQKEKEVQQRVQKEKSKSGSSGNRDW